MPGRIRQNLNLGGGQAESDQYLQPTYVDNGDYASIESQDDPRRFIIGRTGAGKSAVFERLEYCNPQNLTRIAPENLHLSYITNLNIVRELTDIGVRLDPFFNALWKHVIIVELLRHRYPSMTSPSTKQVILDQFIEYFKRDPGKQRAIEYVNTFGDKFWCEADERVHQIGEKIEETVRAKAALDVRPLPKIGAQASSELDRFSQAEIYRELVPKYQRIVNDIQIPRLNEMIRILGETILDSRARFTYLVIDDLDREWADDDIEHLLIRSLFQAVVDMQRVRNLKVLVALRTNIFQQLNFNRAGGGNQQGEKFRNLAFNIRWTRNDLKVLVDKRIMEASKRSEGTQFRSADEVLPSPRPVGVTAWNYVLDRTLLRPRDVLEFMNLALREAAGTDRITWEFLETAEREYSRSRLDALTDEWCDPYVGLGDVLQVFRATEQVLTRERITALLDEVAEVLTHPRFEGTIWEREYIEPFLSAGGQASWYEMYGALVNLLYEIGFIGCAAQEATRLTYAYEDSLFARESRNFGEDCRFAVHPAYRRALEIAS